MTFAEYQAFVAESARGNHEDTRLPLYATLGVVGEAGELAELVKKAMRSGDDLDLIAVAFEAGDVLWYLGRLAAWFGLKVEDFAALNQIKLSRRKAVGKDPAAERRVAEAYLRSRGIL